MTFIRLEAELTRAGNNNYPRWDKSWGDIEVCKWEDWIGTDDLQVNESLARIEMVVNVW